MNTRARNTLPDGSLRRLLAICGVIGPILFIMVIFIFGLLRPGYSPVRQHISELGEVGVTNAIVFNIAGFLLLGLLMIAFAFGLQRGISEGKGSKIGPTLIAVSGAGWVGAAFFHCDPGCVNVSFTGIMHDLTAIIPLFGMLIAPIAISQRLKKDSRWQTITHNTTLVGFLVFYGRE